MAAQIPRCKNAVDGTCKNSNVKLVNENDETTRIQEYQRQYREKNRVLLREKAQKRYYSRHNEVKEHRRKLYRENREEKNQIRRAYMKEYTRKLRKETLDAYGNKCNCCGETIQTFLEIDHIKGDGRKHREVHKGFLYRWLKKRGFPKDDFQLLCSNCNKGKFMNGGICPHKTLGEAKCLTFPVARTA